MPVMSSVEGAFCRTALWTCFTRRVVLPWALQGRTLRGDVLEVGAGGGGMAEGILRSFPDVQLTVTDLDPAMVDAARQRLARFDDVTVIEADSTDLPFVDASFDVLVSFLMLHHVLDWPRALAEARRVLRPGGVLVGYDLEDTWLTRLVHRADRSAYRLVSNGDLSAGLADAGLIAGRPRRCWHGQAQRFLAHKPRRP